MASFLGFDPPSNLRVGGSNPSRRANKTKPRVIVTGESEERSLERQRRCVPIVCQPQCASGSFFESADTLRRSKWYRAAIEGDQEGSMLSAVPTYTPRLSRSALAASSHLIQAKRVHHSYPRAGPICGARTGLAMPKKITTPWPPQRVDSASLAFL